MRGRGIQFLPGAGRGTTAEGGGGGAGRASQFLLQLRWGRGTAAEGGGGGAGAANSLRERLRNATEALRIILGAGSYAAYRDHMAERHPEREAMTEAEFFRARQQARYGGGQGRCC